MSNEALLLNLNSAVRPAVRPSGTELHLLNSNRRAVFFTDYVFLWPLLYDRGN